MGDNQTLSDFDAEVASLGGDQSLTKEGLPYRLELGKHDNKSKIKDKRSKFKKPTAVGCRPAASYLLLFSFLANRDFSLAALFL